MIFHLSSVYKGYHCAHSRRYQWGRGGGGWAPLAEIVEEQKFVSKSKENYKRKTSILRLTSKFIWRSSYNIQKGSHLVGGMFMLVGLRKKLWAGGMTCWAPA